MGVAKNKIKQVGSVKFDSDSKDNQIDLSIQRSNNLILAASTHIGEDEMLAETFIKLKENFKNLRLVIVPRHPERSGSVLKI
jgi:3-deoxy-D-manno-octulosonic-acid transferase